MVDNYDQKDLFALGLKSISLKMEEQHDLEDSGFSIFSAPKKLKTELGWRKAIMFLRAIS